MILENEDRKNSAANFFDFYQPFSVKLVDFWGKFQEKYGKL